MNDLTLPGRAVAAKQDGSQLTTIGIASEQQREIAEIQSALTVAQKFPRDEDKCIERIKRSCKRESLAMISEYLYARGGNDISGPSIHLLRVLAQHWRNIEYGWRVLSSNNAESTVKMYAWDLESNSKETRTVVVPHRRDTSKGSYPLRDQRDVYEHVANVAARRMRACLEGVIPNDVIESAREICQRVLIESADLSEESVHKIVAAFKDLGVSKQQLETFIQRDMEKIRPAHVVRLRRIRQSIKDGMSRPGDWFKGAEKKVTSATKRKVAGSATQKTEPPPNDPPESSSDDEQAASDAAETVTEQTPPEASSPATMEEPPEEQTPYTWHQIATLIGEQDKIGTVQEMVGQLCDACPEDMHERIRDIGEERKAEIREKR